MKKDALEKLAGLLAQFKSDYYGYENTPEIDVVLEIIDNEINA